MTGVLRTARACDLGMPASLAEAQQRADASVAAAIAAGFVPESLEVLPSIAASGAPLDCLALVASRYGQQPWPVTNAAIRLLKPDQPPPFTSVLDGLVYAESVAQSSGPTPALRSVGLLSLVIAGVASDVLALLYTNNPLISMGIVPDSSDLPFDVANLPDGIEIEVFWCRQPFKLNKLSVAAGDGGITVQPASVGAWERKLVPVPLWTAKLAWSHDRLLGSDKNTGDPGSPLLTVQEVNRRLRLFNLSDYTISGNGYLAPDSMRMTGELSDKGTGSVAALPVGSAARIMYLGVTDAAAGSITDVFTATAAGAGNNPSTITAVGNALGTTFLGFQCEILTGAAAGARFQPVFDLGGSQVEISEPCFPATGVRATFPSPGDSYRVLDSSLVTGPIGGALGTPKRVEIWHKDVTISSAFFRPDAAFGAFEGCAVTVAMVPPPLYEVTDIFFRVCAIRAAAVANFCQIGVGHVRFVGTGLKRQRLQVSGTGRITFVDSLMDGAGIRPVDAANGRSGGGRVVLQGKCFISRAPAGESAITGLGGMDVAVVVTGTTLGGKLNTVCGVDLDSGSRMYVVAGTVPTITGTTQELRLAGLAVAFQFLETGGIGAPIPLTTWAQWNDAVVVPNVSGFARTVMSYKGCGACVVNRP